MDLRLFRVSVAPKDRQELSLPWQEETLSLAQMRMPPAACPWSTILPVWTVHLKSGDCSSRKAWTTSTRYPSVGVHDLLIDVEAEIMSDDVACQNTLSKNLLDMLLA